MISVILAIFGVIICQILLFAFALVLIKRRISSLSEIAHSFLVSAEPGKPSPFADILDNLASRLATAIVAQVKGWLLSQNSIAVRQEKALIKEQLREQAPPLINMLMKYAPGVRKIAEKNPEIVQLALNALQQGQEGKSKNNGHEPVNTSNPFKV